MNKRNRFRAGLGFGIAMAIFYILQNLLTNDHLTSKEIIKAVVSGLIAGLISGFLFGWLMGLFSKSKFVQETTKIQLDPNETMLFHTPANHFKGMEGVGGKLYLTNRRLVFQSHKLNIQNHQLSINVSDIRNADRYKPSGIINNGLTIIRNNDTTEKFVVEEADEWVKQIEFTKKSLQQ
jgi:hypothetical protein